MRFLVLLLFLGAHQRAAAHPHVFVEYSFDLLFTSDGLEGLRSSGRLHLHPARRASHPREGTIEVVADDPDLYFAMAYDARTPARALPSGSARVTCARSKERQPFKPLGITCSLRR